jgi:hypothetical protein
MAAKQKHLIIKASGIVEPFSLRKVFISARNAGAKRDQAERIAKTIEKELHPGMNTSQIYERVRALLREDSLNASIKFSLKEAMKRLGPTGFNFEKFIAEILEREGYSVAINQRIDGKIIPRYEIDFVARKGKNVFLGECKYHWMANDKIDLKVALYNYARYLDIIEGPYFKTKEYRGCKVSPMIVANVQFTNLVIQYAEAKGISLLGWHYPKAVGLETLIEEQKLYPATILPSFDRKYDKELADHKINLAKEFLEHNPEKFAQELGMPVEIVRKLYEEAKSLLENGKSGFDKKV